VAPSADTVFAITKSDLYAGNPVSFPAFTVGSQAVPASNAGEPMIGSQYSYFLGADPQIGYELYRMTGSGTSDPAVSLVATMGPPYTPPAQASQPPGDPGLNTGDGRITFSPVYDGSRIWFAHGIQWPDHPATVRYGYIDLASNSEFHALITVDPPFSEFNGSVGVGLNADGTEAIFLNWAYTAPNSNFQVSDAVDAFVWNGGGLGWPQDTKGHEQTLITGGPSSQANFGSYSSVAVEPTTSGVTTCAVTTQEYFDSVGWKTRLARVCSPTTIGAPYIGGYTTEQAASILAGYDLSAGAQTTTTNCDPAFEDGLVVGSVPAFDQPVPLGSAVGLVVCAVAVPNVIGETTVNATSDVQAAGLLVGAYADEFKCDAAAGGTVTATNPAAGTVLPYQSFITLAVCIPPPPPGIVPDLTGDTRTGATQQLSAAGYILGAVHTAIDDSCSFIGLVMDQSPAAGAQASPGSFVSITLGRAPKFCAP
jgi:beta-lactam-binding protein with PASTA domain